jgi:hypothetical protein
MEIRQRVAFQFRRNVKRIEALSRLRKKPSAGDPRRPDSHVSRDTQRENSSPCITHDCNFHIFVSTHRQTDKMVFDGNPTNIGYCDKIGGGTIPITLHPGR